MSNFIHNVKQLGEATGLKPKYIGRIYEVVPELEKYRTQSAYDNNAYLYDGNAITIFHKVKEWKVQLKDRLQIRDLLYGSDLVKRGEGTTTLDSSQESTPENHTNKPPTASLGRKPAQGSDPTFEEKKADADKEGKRSSNPSESDMQRALQLIEKSNDNSVEAWRTTAEFYRADAEKVREQNTELMAVVSKLLPSANIERESKSDEE